MHFDDRIHYHCTEQFGCHFGAMGVGRVHFGRCLFNRVMFGRAYCLGRA